MCWIGSRLPLGAGACGWRSARLGGRILSSCAMAPPCVLSNDSADYGAGRGVSAGFRAAGRLEALACGCVRVSSAFQPCPG